MPGDDANTNQFIKEIQQKMEKLQIENDEFRKEKDKADKEKDEFRKKIDKFGKEKDEFRKKIDKFGKEKDEFRKKIDKFGKEKDEFRKKIDKVGKKNDKLQKEIDKVYKEKDELQENVNELQENINELQANNDQLQKNNNELQEINDDLIKELRRKNEIIEQEFAKINERQRTIWEEEERKPRTEKLDYEEFMSLVAELSPSELFDIDSLDQNHLSSKSTNTIKVIGIFKGIESCEQRIGNLVEQKRNDRFSRLKKVLKFPSRSWITECFKMDYKKLPENETELVLTVYCTTIMIVTAAVNAILKASYLDMTVSYRPVISKELENSCAKYLDENMPSDVLKSVRYLRPDGCYVIKDNKLIMIAEYKSVQKITREDYEQFIRYLEAHKNEKPSPVENYSEGIASDNTNFNKYMAFFHQMHNYKTKYDTDHLFLTSGRCWIFFLPSLKGPETLAHHTIFIDGPNRKESIRKVNEILISMLLDSLDNADIPTRGNSRFFRSFKLRRNLRGKKSDQSNDTNKNNSSSSTTRQTQASSKGKKRKRT